MDVPQDRKRNMENLDKIVELLGVLIEKTEDTNDFLRDIKTQMYQRDSYP